jgi:DNA adenine methylase
MSMRREEKATNASPFLRWPGGKRWLVDRIRKEIQGQPFVRYFEPFLGGGALFFALRPRQAFLCDINADLINAYQQVKRRPRELIAELQSLPIDEHTYTELRIAVPSRRLSKAVRFLYLNRTAFSGMYRVNRFGEFNVPFGGGERTPAVLWTQNLLMNASRVLRHATLRVCDFEDAMSLGTAGDLVYCDPTYTVAHNNNGFIRYNEKNFSWADQKRLAACCRDAAQRGATVLVSNAYHREVLELFQPSKALIVDRRSLLCPQADFRKAVQEYLFVFRPTRASRTK